MWLHIGNLKDEKLMENKERQEEQTKQQQEAAQQQDPQSGTEEQTQTEAATLEAQLQQLQEEHATLKDKYLRLFAEFDNYKKRMLREKVETINMAAQDTIMALLPILDDFDRAIKAAQQEESGEKIPEGVLLLYNKLYGALKSKGLEPMDSDGEPFDPELHEAVTEIPAPDPSLKGKVVDTIEKGYFLKNRIIRHAKVVVGK